MTGRTLIKRSELTDDLAALVGEALVVRLCESLGGTRVYVPKTIGADHEITAAIGAKAAGVLAEHYHGTVLLLPKAFSRRARALELVKNGTPVAQAARMTDYSERHLYRVLADEDDGQLSLLDLL